MTEIARRLFIVVAFVAIVGVVVWQPWRAPERTATVTVTDADGNTIAGDGFVPVPDFGASAPHALVRYEMPESGSSPPLPEGVAALAWSDLWSDGETVPLVSAGPRIGTPGQEEFPEGTPDKDIADFFLDISDMRAMQPLVGAVRRDLDGRRVRLAGYTTPIGFSQSETAFLLVPELGACIHVPPPPPNQIVYVPQPRGTTAMFEPVWITGTLRAEPAATILADVGYRMEDAVVEPYR